MLWYLPWSESIKKRACRYLLQRYLGNFLEEKLTLNQLSVDLYNGTGTVSDVSLDCEVNICIFIICGAYQLNVYIPNFSFSTIQSSLPILNAHILFKSTRVSNCVCEQREFSLQCFYLRFLYEQNL